MGRSRYEEALNDLFARTTGAFKFGLERTREILAVLGDPHLRVPCVHIGGTNGKGSSVATAAALLQSRGLRVATYTSPHLVEFRERIVVAGEPIAEEAVVEFVARHSRLIERTGASFFEATTAMAFDHIARWAPDVAVIEVGLGGRLDATNVVDPLAAGVVTIGRDHTEYLGNTLEAIAGEKAGIFKQGTPAVIGEQDPVVRRILTHDAHGRGARPVRLLADEVVIEDVHLESRATVFHLSTGAGRAQLETPLMGRHQAANTAFAWMLVDAAGPRYSVPLAETADALHNVYLPGRFDRRGDYIFDVAHNPAGTAVLADTLRLVAPERPVVAVFTALIDKEWRSMLSTLAPVVDSIVATVAPSAPSNRVWNLDDVASFAADARIDLRVVPDLEAALAAARAAGQTVLVTGSFHTVGDAMSCLQLSPLAR